MAENETRAVHELREFAVLGALVMAERHGQSLDVDAVRDFMRTTIEDLEAAAIAAHTVTPAELDAGGRALCGKGDAYWAQLTDGPRDVWRDDARHVFEAAEVVRRGWV